MPRISEPHVIFNVRMDMETEARRRRLQHALNCTGPELAARALRALEDSIKPKRRVEEAAEGATA